MSTRPIKNVEVEQIDDEVQWWMVMRMHVSMWGRSFSWLRLMHVRPSSGNSPSWRIRERKGDGESQTPLVMITTIILLARACLKELSIGGKSWWNHNRRISCKNNMEGIKSLAYIQGQCVYSFMIWRS